jgi:drug/metabolite transporter (DMT)-like permease
MQWVLLTFGAVIIWTIENIIDRRVLSRECRHPVVGTIITGTILFVFLTFFSLFIPGGIRAWSSAACLALLVGMTGGGISYAYYKSLQFGEVSRVTPLFSTSAIFALPFAAIILEERFHVISYAGVCCIIVGAVLISLNRMRETFTLDRAALFGITVGFLSAVYGLLIKLATSHADVLNLLFWIGLGEFIITAGLYARFRREIHKKHPETYHHGIKLLILTNVLDVIAVILIVLAFAQGPLTLVTALEETKPLFVFLASLGIATLKPAYIRERFTRTQMLKKLAATILIITGSLLVIL